MAIIAEEIRRPAVSRNPFIWVRKNLFNTWYNSVLTLVGAWVLYKLVVNLFSWIIFRADWRPITTSPLLYFVGQYPREELWRIGLAMMIVSFFFGLSWGVWGSLIRAFALALGVGYAMGGLLPVSLEAMGLPLRLFLLSNIAILAIGYWLGCTPIGRPRWVVMGWLVSFVVVILLLRGFQDNPTMPLVSTGLWGGLMLNLLLAAVGIGASFPLGVLLALGRRSDLAIVRLFSIVYIEVIRGVPLVSLLFMGSILLPLFLPEDVRIDRILRALLAIILFAAAYMAENVRGGLQAIPKGQYEAAQAIGLNSFQTMFLIILPQALRLVIPAIVGQFISLFKDTTLVAIVGLTEILGIAKSIVLGNPEFVGAQDEVYLFVAAVFWVFTYAMAYSSRRLEKAVGVGER